MSSRQSKAKFQLDDLHKKSPDKCLVIVPVLRPDPGEPGREIVHTRSNAARLEEAIGLAQAIELDVVDQGIVNVSTPRPATLIGSGKVDEIGGLVAAHHAGLVIVDHGLTPVQQQNLEKAWNCKVLDRTGLILEIFGARARTKEGRLQVELAHLNYQKGRLVRSWTHLERQRGGLGFVGGPGETQIEADRRMLSERIKAIGRDLEKVRRTRRLHREKRKKVPHPVLALVGYTNAGKSTLFNALTKADVYAQDQLFATLDPTLRRLVLPEGTRIILSDTVGFVSDLPTSLIAAFRATLEEVVEADLILHVRDIADPDSGAQAADVARVLGELEIDSEDNGRVLEVWNKIDVLAEERLDAVRIAAGEGRDAPVLVSAQQRTGLADLQARIEDRIAGDQSLMDVTLNPSQMGMLSWIYSNAHVIDRDDAEDGTAKFKLRLSKRNQSELSGLLAGRG
ncbi:MAG: GTPase HflX [Pseudomonadota bacterium]